MLSTYLWIAFGSAIGGMSRYGVSRVFAFWFGETFPWGTLVVNISGCFLIGILSGLTGPDGRMLVSPDFRQFLLVGLCGGYTTFSSFSLQTLALMRQGDMIEASANVLLSVVICMIFVWFGTITATLFNQVRAVG
ncbi:camphor resistance protein CrcB [Hephaestia caeni]|uniref:Fluoride-specific ion channel FluC n=1 Tax=Hephaestia caeni TaxID=645617 RepID=A0A397PFU9_9SPHN|nr:fluoride efflux transporter CrcB [Hephaestia caeni]RIA46709.1 camphor resistance protein CrcB [Hephaestia caeni]